MDKGAQGQTEGGQWYKADAGQDVPTPGQSPAAPAPRQDEVVQWTASEFIAHSKGFKWYALLILASAAATGLVYWLTRDRITAGVILFCAFIFGVAGARKPRVLGYRLDGSGLTIADRFYPYVNYKAFTIVDEGRFASVTLLPMKRFMPGINIYFAPEDEEHIVDVLSTHLPMQPGGNSTIDSVMRRVRF